MKIAKEMYEAHGELSDCSAAFLEFVEKNPACLERSAFDTVLSDKRFAYFSSQPWPTFINDRKKKEVEAAALKVHHLIQSIIPRLFSYNSREISSYFEIDEGMTKLLLYGVDDDHMKNLLGRGDFILTPSGEFKCLEFNMQTNLGGWELDFLEPLYVGTPIISRFLKESDARVRRNQFFPLLFQHVLDAFLVRHPGVLEGREMSEINMAIVFYRSKGFLQAETALPLRNLYKSVLQQKNNDLKGGLFLCGYESLKVEGDSLVYAGQKIHILIEMCNGYIPILFMDTVKKGNVILYNGPITRLISNKLNLALLSEHQDSAVFSPGEREVIKKYIPWTRKVVPGETTFGTGKVRLEDFVLSQQERLVLKSAAGRGGHEVFPGCGTPPGEWKQRVEKALEEKRWVVQEYVSPSSYLYQHGDIGCTPHHAVWGFFVFGSRYAGGYVRVLPEKHDRGVINTHQGAEESIILEVMES
jgi:hypothetical protein